jgi:putative phosphoribosyl transferase
MPTQLARIFVDRHAAGRELGQRLQPLVLQSPVVLGLARGGVPVASEVALALDAPLDVLVVRKIGAPGNPELGLGAVAEGGAWVLNRNVIRGLEVSSEELEAAAARARREIGAQTERYRGGGPLLDVEGHDVIVVDDGLATGATARAAIRDVRSRGVRKLILAVPVGAAATVESLRFEADAVVCLQQPEPLNAVGLWYEQFEPTSDREVRTLLAGGDHHPQREHQPSHAVAGAAPAEVQIPAGPLKLIGDLTVPDLATGLVVFAHGSGSSRHSPRNREVARLLNERGLATLLVDLLTAEEEGYRPNVFDIKLLGGRLADVTRWAGGQSRLHDLRIGYFGASTGAAAALWAAADLGERVDAVVSRGGRPDLAVERLGAVRAPVLLLVGGQDETVLVLNRSAQALLDAPSELQVIPGATHLFEEPGALAQVARHAGDWFARHLATGAEYPA